MKFSLWVEKRERRNQKSATKLPKVRSKEELAVHSSKARVHDMAGHGNSKTYGRAGTSEPDIHKGTRSKKNRDAIKSFD